MRRWLRVDQGFAGGLPLMKLSWDGRVDGEVVQFIASYMGRYYALVTNLDSLPEIIQINKREFDFARRNYDISYEEWSGITIYEAIDENNGFYYHDFINKVLADVDDPFTNNEIEIVTIPTIDLNMQFEDLFT